MEWRFFARINILRFAKNKFFQISISTTNALIQKCNFKSAILKFYEPTQQKLFLWKDEIGHRPYCYSKLSPDELDFLQEREDVLEIKTVKKHDFIHDKEIDVSKIVVDT